LIFYFFYEKYMQGNFEASIKNKILKKMKTNLLFLALVLFAKTVSAQVSITTNGAAPHASAMLDISSINKGLLLPRMTTAQRTAIAAPAIGLMVFDNNSNSNWLFTASGWSNTSQAGGGFTLPYSQAVNLAGNVFKIENTGSAETMTLGNLGSGAGLNVYTVDGAGININASNNFGMIANSYASSAIYAYNNNDANSLATIRASNTGAGSAIFATADNAKPAIDAENTNNLGTAIKGNSTNHNGILGISGGTSTAGVRGEATGTAGNGIYGIASGTSGVGVYGQGTSSSTGVYGWSNSGTGVKAFSSSGLALDVIGKLKISGGNTNPSAGAVLTSDASGNAVWQNNKIAFRAKGVSSTFIHFPHNVNTRVQWEAEEFDYGSDYFLQVGISTGALSSTFTAPVAGLYHFDAALQYKTTDDSDFFGGSLYLIVNRNGTVVNKVRTEGNVDAATIFVNNSSLVTDLKLLAGDRVYLETWIFNTQEVGGTILGNSEKCYFNGHLVFAD
jgi:hypothetical protein